MFAVNTSGETTIPEEENESAAAGSTRWYVSTIARLRKTRTPINPQGSGEVEAVCNAAFQDGAQAVHSVPVPSDCRFDTARLTR